MITITETYFNSLRERSKEAIEICAEYLDPEIIPSLKVINSIPGLVSIWSCEGHFGKNTVTAKRYVVVGISEKRPELLENILEIFSSVDPKEENFYFPSIEILRLSEIGCAFDSLKKQSVLKIKIVIRADPKEIDSKERKERTNIFWNSIFERIRILSEEKYKNLSEIKHLNSLAYTIRT